MDFYQKDIQPKDASQIGFWRTAEEEFPSSLQTGPVAATRVGPAHAALLYARGSWNDCYVVSFCGGRTVDPPPPPIPEHHASLYRNATFLWRPGDLEATDRSPAEHDLFCCGHALIRCGHLLVAGGAQVPSPGIPTHNKTALYDRTSKSWNPSQSMEAYRYYPTLITLGSGNVLALQGINGNGTDYGPPEEFNGFNWTRLREVNRPPDNMPNGRTKLQFYPRVHQMGGGLLFHSSPLYGPTGQLTTYFFARRPDGALVWQNACEFPSADYNNFGVDDTHDAWELENSNGWHTQAVLLPLIPNDDGGYKKGEIVINGGEKRYFLDLGKDKPCWEELPADENGKRLCGIATILADGSVFISGGVTQRHHGGHFRTDCELLTYVDGRKVFCAVADSLRQRVYHYTALLLPDGTVWTAGGEDTCKLDVQNAIDIYVPPYLCTGTPRPEVDIKGLSSGDNNQIAYYGSKLIVDITNAVPVKKLALVRCGSVTHGFDGDQRYVVLQETALPSRRGFHPCRFEVSIPWDACVAPPGAYMLFAISQDGVPSIGRIIFLENRIL